MTDAVPQTGVLSVYRDTLEPVYEEICGDSATYPGVETQFSSYLETLTEPPESVAQAFRDFLAYGQNCHESSSASRALANAQSIVTDLQPTIASAVNGPSLFEPFRLFRKAYVELIELIHILSNSEFLKSADSKGGAWSVDRAAMMRMWRTANHAHMLSANLLFETAKKLFELRSNEPETAVIRAQHAMLLKFNITVFEFVQAMDPAQSYELKPVVDRIDSFERVHTELMNPLNWAARLFPEVVKLTAHTLPKGFGILVHSAYRDLPLQHEVPAALMELMERIFFVVARTGTPLDMSIVGSGGTTPRYDLVISSGRSLVALRADPVIAYLVNFLRATWDTPGLLSSIFTRPFQTLRGTRHRIIVPLQISGLSHPVANNGGPRTTGFPSPVGNDPAHAATVLQIQATGALLMSGGARPPVNASIGIMPTMPLIMNPLLR